MGSVNRDANDLKILIYYHIATWSRTFINYFWRPLLRGGLHQRLHDSQQWENSIKTRRLSGRLIFEILAAFNKLLQPKFYLGPSPWWHRYTLCIITYTLVNWIRSLLQQTQWCIMWYYFNIVSSSCDNIAIRSSDN